MRCCCSTASAAVSSCFWSAIVCSSILSAERRWIGMVPVGFEFAMPPGTATAEPSRAPRVCEADGEASMATRALWKGHLSIGELSCAVALYAAATTSERVSFHIVNRKTGNRVRREYVDEETGKPVDRDDQVKGYETSKGNYVLLEPDEIAAAVPE